LYLNVGHRTHPVRVERSRDTRRSVANVRVEAWQGDREKLVASSWMNFLLAPPKEG
jgi:hypothetical protein